MLELDEVTIQDINHAMRWFKSLEQQANGDPDRANNLFRAMMGRLRTPYAKPPVVMRRYYEDEVNPLGWRDPIDRGSGRFHVLFWSEEYVLVSRIFDSVWECQMMTWKQFLTN